MAIDGVNLRVFGVDPSLWLGCHELAGLFSVKVNPKTGKPVDGVKKALYKGLRFEIKPYPDGKTGMTIRGSLHKYFNNGSHNCNQFGHNDLLCVIRDLEARFSLLPDRTIIENIEIGVNVEVPFEVKKILTSLICYSDKTFEAMDGRLPDIGRICPSSDFDVKVYDKVAQSISGSTLPPGFKTAHLLRFEISTKKMRWLSSCEIRTLSDLLERNKVYGVLGLMAAVLNKIVFVDIAADVSMLSDSDHALYGLFRDRDKWRQFDKRKRYKMRHRLPGLLRKCNAFDYAGLLNTLLVETWGALFPEAENEGLLHRLPECLEMSEANGGATISPLEYNGAIVPFEEERKKKMSKPEGLSVSLSPLPKEKENRKKKMSKPEKPKVCRCCGKDISDQRQGSRFCSEKTKGKEAKKCRNWESNNRRDKKRIVMKAKEANQYLVVSYLYKGVVYSDTLHSSEIDPCREWLDRVVSVKLAPGITEGGGSEVLVYSEAREYLQKLAGFNGQPG